MGDLHTQYPNQKLATEIEQLQFQLNESNQALNQSQKEIEQIHHNHGILPMSQPPISNPWKIDPNHAIGILEKGDSKTTASKKSPSLPLGLVTMAIAAIASGMACFHFGTLILNDLDNQRETNARTELARIRSCIN